MILEGKIKDAKMSSLIRFPNTHKTLIYFVFSLWIVNEFEKEFYQTVKGVLSRHFRAQTSAKEKGFYNV